MIRAHVPRLNRPPLFWRLFGAYMAVNIITLVAVGASTGYLMRSRLLEAKEAALAARLRPLTVPGTMMGVLGRDPRVFLEAMKPLLEIDEAYLVSADYLQTHDSLVQPTADGTISLNQSDMEQLRQGYLVSTWLGRGLFVVPPLGVAVPLSQGGALLVSASLSDVRATLESMQHLILLTGLGGTLLAAVLAFMLSQGIAAPLSRLNRLAREFAGGDFSARAEVESLDEVGQVALTFNLAAERIETTLEQQRELMEQQQVLVEQQKSLDQFRRDFMANVSHEFRAPLASLRGYLELMLDGTVRPEEQKHVLGVMLDDSLRLGRLVDDLLDLARLQAHRTSMRREPVDVLEVMDRVLTAFESRAARKSVALVSAPPLGLDSPDLPPVLGDEDRIIQVLTNLVDNALRFTPENGRIKVKAEPHGSFLRLSVQDNGRGVPESEIDHIWDRFYKVDKARTPGEHGPEGGGTGLGLAIIKEIVTSLGGEVGCESRFGEGSTFWADLPLVGDAPIGDSPADDATAGNED